MMEQQTHQHEETAKQTKKYFIEIQSDFKSPLPQYAQNRQ